MSERGWLSRRKRKRPVNGTVAISKRGIATDLAPAPSPPSSTTANDNDASAPPPPPSSSSSTNATAALPASLLPHLGWTKLSACHPRRRPRAKAGNGGWNREEGVRKVAGRAVFFVHDPRRGDAASDGDGDAMWFQGRFFPSAGAGGGPSTGRAAPPASASSGRVAAPPSAGGGGVATNDSWGLLAVQNEIADGCLACSEGGYRELDLTFVRRQRKTTAASRSGRKERKLRWSARDVVWTGGNMMALSTEHPYSYSLPRDEPGMNFEPRRLMEGERAMEVAAKYFPSMTKRLRIRNVMTNDNDEEEESEMNDSEAMVIIGDMEVVAPSSFVKLRNSYGDDSSDDDGLWNDD